MLTLNSSSLCQVTINDMNKVLSETIPPRLPLKSVEEVESLLKSVCHEIQKDSTIIRICSEYGADETLMEDLQRQLDTATMLQFEKFKKLNSELLATTTQDLDAALRASVNRMTAAVDQTLAKLRSDPDPTPLSRCTKSLDSIFFDEKARLEESIRAILGQQSGLDVKPHIESAVDTLFELCQKLSQDVKSAHMAARQSSIREAVNRCVDEISARSESFLDDQSDLMSEDELLDLLDRLVRECQSQERALVSGWGCSEEEYEELLVKPVDSGVSRVRKNLLLIHGQLSKLKGKSTLKPINSEPEEARQSEKRPLDSPEVSSLKRRRTTLRVPTHSPSSNASCFEVKQDFPDTRSQTMMQAQSIFTVTDSAAEQKRKAKEWSNRLNSRLSSTTSSTISSHNSSTDEMKQEQPPAPLTPVEAAKLAEQEKIKAQIRHRVEKLSQTQETDEGEQNRRRSSAAATRKSSTTKVRRGKK